MGTPVILGERFRLENLTARGGMGAVYRGFDLVTGQPIAVKIGSHESRSQAARFAREAMVLARLSHPGIVRYIASGNGPEESQAYLVMEWVEGMTLRERIASGPLGVDDAVACAAAIARALAAAHAAGVVHRDLKPGNIMLVGGDPENVRLIDFGVARPIDVEDEVTGTGAVIGTAGYMAPEQARDSSSIGAPADVYALGCVLFKCLTGATPFTGEDLLAILVKLVLEEPPRLRSVRADVPEWLDHLVSQMLEREPEYRPASAAAVATTLERRRDASSPSHTTIFPRAGAARGGALTASERSFGCAVLAAAASDDLVLVLSDEDRKALVDAARPLGAEVHFLADRSILAAIPAEGRATDRAARAARTALALRPLLIGMPLCVLVGEHAASNRVAEALDRNLPMLRRDRSFAIRLDETAAGLLDARFDIGGDELGLYLRGERDAGQISRTLLGKPTPCVGREREMGTLLAILAEVVEERAARAALVTGDAGAGKSRLRHEVVRRAEQSHPELEVWIGRSDPLAAGSPFALLSQALRRATGIGATDSPDVAQKKLRARVGRHVSGALAQSTTEFLGEVCALPFDDAASVQLRAARREPPLMADQMLRAFETLVRAETEAGPLLIVLEDLHWGDLPSLRFVDAVMRHEWPICVLAVARPEVHTRFPDLFRRASMTEIRLPALSKKSATQLARVVLGQEADAALIGKLVDMSAGNAFYLEELLRAAAAGKVDSLPQTVLAMAQSVLDTLDPSSRMALRACSLLVASIRTEPLAAMLGVSAADARALLDPLVFSELLTKLRAVPGSPGEEYAFRHALLREAAYAMLDEADRMRGHRRAAEVLEAAGERDPMLLAEHYERGGQPADAVTHYLHAAEQALAGNDLADAIERADRAIGCGAAGPQLGALHLVKAEAERWRGRNTEGRAHALAALEALPTGSAPWCTAASELASCALKLLEPATVDDLGEQLIACVAKAGQSASAALMVACARVAAAALLGGRAKTAAALLDVLVQADDGAVATAPEVRARVLETRAIAALCEGDLCAFVERSELATGAFLEIGDVRSATIQHANQGHVYGALGAYERAETALREVLTHAEPLALPQLLSAAKQNLGNVLSRVGKFAEARTLLEESLAAAIAQGDRRLEVGARVYLSLCASATGDLDTALNQVADITTKGMPALHVYALGARARALLAKGRTDEALGAAEEAMDSLRRLGGTIEEGEALVRLTHIEALISAGRRDQAAEALAEARRAIEKRAERIQNPILRQTFLDRVAENAQTFDLAAKGMRAVG
ncbi:MAG: protein kinase [Polyangiaceae bacterium]|nr:protein kinase [Polyangiaceae bacterium]